MKTGLMAAAALLLAAATAAPGALAAGPRASSANNWPGMAAEPTQSPPALTGAPAAAQPHYVWQEGYDHHGRWRGSWVLVP